MKIYNSFDTYFLLANLLGNWYWTDYHIKKKSLMTKGIKIFIPPCDRNVHNSSLF